MNLSFEIFRGFKSSIPRVSGGEPNMIWIGSDYIKYSPRERG